MATHTSGTVAVTSLTAFVYSTGQKGLVPLFSSTEAQIIPRAELTQLDGKKMSGTISTLAQLWENGVKGFMAKGNFGEPFPTNARVLHQAELSGSFAHTRHPITPGVPITENAVFFGTLSAAHKDSSSVISINPDQWTVASLTVELPSGTPIPIEVGNPITVSMKATQKVSRVRSVTADARLSGTIGRRQYSGLGADTQMRVVE